MATRLERLRALYNRLPQIACQGKCWDSCGPISASQTELARMERHGGPYVLREHPLAGGTPMCGYLSDEGRCAVYAQRPMICRLWGVVEGLPCHHGCEPVTHRLPDSVGMILLGRSLALGGDGSLTMATVDELARAIESGRAGIRMSNVPGRTTVAFWGDR